ncbi:MAG: hypothetical protein ACI9JY_001524, partial [Saprospiraceae bacterium]
MGLIPPLKQLFFMKIPIELFAIFFLFFLSINVVKAQSPFSTDAHVVHGGLGLRSYGGNFGLNTNVNSLPILSVSYDQGIIDNLGIGNLGVGAGMGIKFYSANGLNTNWTRIFFGARGTYHFDFVNSDSFDFYAGAVAGFYFETTNNKDAYNTTSGSFGGPIAGINYWITPTFGLYGEAGFGFGFLN